MPHLPRYEHASMAGVACTCVLQVDEEAASSSGRNAVRQIAVAYSHPNWMVSRCVASTCAPHLTKPNQTSPPPPAERIFAHARRCMALCCAWTQPAVHALALAQRRGEGELLRRARPICARMHAFLVEGFACVGRRWLKRFGHEATYRLLNHNNTPPAYGVRVNPGRGMSVEQLLAELAEAGVEAERSPFLPHEFVRVHSGMQALLAQVRAGPRRSGLCGGSSGCFARGATCFASSARSACSPSCML